MQWGATRSSAVTKCETIFSTNVPSRLWSANGNYRVATTSVPEISCSQNTRSKNVCFAPPFVPPSAHTASRYLYAIAKVWQIILWTLQVTAVELKRRRNPRFKSASVECREPRFESASVDATNLSMQIPAVLKLRLRTAIDDR